MRGQPFGFFVEVDGAGEAPPEHGVADEGHLLLPALGCCSFQAVFADYIPECCFIFLRLGWSCLIQEFAG